MVEVVVVVSREEASSSHIDQARSSALSNSWIRSHFLELGRYHSISFRKGLKKRSPLSSLVEQQNFTLSDKISLSKFSSSEGGTMKDRGSQSGTISPKNDCPIEISDAGSVRSTTPLPDSATTSSSTTPSSPKASYATQRELINSSDTLTLIPSPEAKVASSSIEGGVHADMKESQSLEDSSNTMQEGPNLSEGVALMAAKGTGQTISTKRLLIASLVSPGHEWDIMQGKEDEAVEQQVSALGLEGIHITAGPGKGLEISRTPSQSTTGTVESSTAGSLETAASSLQSAPSSDTALHEKEVASKPSTSSSHPSPSPHLYVTARSSCEDFDLEKRNSSALRRYHALMELVETEKSYAEDLNTLVNVFFKNLTSQAFFDESEPRLNAVCRNAKDLLELHTYLATKLNQVVEECGLLAEAEGSDVEKALRCENAVVKIAQRLTKSTPYFELYQLFCSRHAEALVLIREAEKRHGGDDFAAFERMCGNLIRGQIKGNGTKTPSSRRSSAGTSTPLAFTGTIEEQFPTSDPPSGSTTPSGSFASLSRQNTGRLLFADYLIKPIQRLCLYPVVLNSLLKYTPENETSTHQALQTALTSMKKIADNVDRASRQRERDLMAELLVSKVEPQLGITHHLLKSFGNPLLSGALDVLYHHDTLSPLTAPLRFQRLGLILWRGFLLIVRVRKNQQLDCKYWFPLSKATLASLEDVKAPGTEVSSWQANNALAPFSIRLSYHGHHFEISATNEKERQIWHDRLKLAVEDSEFVLESLPCSLTGDSSALYTSASDSIYHFIINNVKTSSTSSSSSSTSTSISSSSAATATASPSYIIPDFLIKLSTASNRVNVDRNMIFSDVLLSQSGFNSATSNSGGGFGPINLTSKEITEALIVQQIRQNSTPSIGSAVGAAMGLARMAATQVPTAVKRARRQSTLNLTEINPTCDVLLIEVPNNDGNLSSGTPSPITGRNSMSAASRLSSSNTLNDGGESTSSKWKNSILRRNSRTMSAKSAINLTSMSPSPVMSTTDLNQLIDGHVTLSASPMEESSGFSGISFSTTRPSTPLRTKSISFRDVWQNSIGRRSRSHSINSELASSETQRGAEDSGVVSPAASNAASLTSSPVLEKDDDEMQDDVQAKKEVGGVESTSSEKRESLPFSSVTQLRRILSTTSSQGNILRSKSSRNGSLANATSSLFSTSTNGARGRIERSKTEMNESNFPTFQTYDGSERRKSEPQTALILEQGDSKSSPSFTNSAKSSLRRLRRRSSNSSIINFANSTWKDPSRLNSVEENNAEHNEHADLLNKGKKPPRPMLNRRPSSAE